MRSSSTLLCTLLMFPVVGLMTWSSNLEASNRDSAKEIKDNLLDLPSSRVALQKLGLPFAVVWDNQPIREAMQSLATSQRIALWIDRRVDPNQTVSLSSRSSETLAELLDKLAAQLDVDVGFVGAVLVVCPEGKLEALQYAAIELHQAIAQIYSDQANAAISFAWPELTTPNEFVEACITGKLSVSEELPHDLLHAGALEKSTLATRLVLVCGGFDKVPKLTATPNKTVQFQQLPEPRSWSTTYELTHLNGLARKPREVSLLARRLGGRAIRQGNRLALTGPTSLHLRLLLQERAAKAATGRDPFVNQVFSFEIKKEKLGAILKSLAYSLELELNWEEGVYDSKAAALVSLNVNRELIDSVFASLAREANVKIQRQGKTVTIANP